VVDIKNPDTPPIRMEYQSKSRRHASLALSFATISGSGVRELLKRLAKRAGLNGVRITPHAFRHGFVHRLAAAGVPISIISQACGHADVLTTFLYLRRTGLGNESVAALRRFDWN
jgi:integrase